MVRAHSAYVVAANTLKTEETIDRFDRRSHHSVWLHKGEWRGQRASFILLGAGEKLIGYNALKVSSQQAEQLIQILPKVTPLGGFNSIFRDYTNNIGHDHVHFKVFGRVNRSDTHRF